MKPTGARTEFLRENEHKIGMEVLILDEFKNDARFKSFLVGKVQLDDDSERLLGLNQTSYYRISKNDAFGADTKFWNGKKIRYLGKQKLEKYPVTPRVWEAITPEINLDADRPF